MREAAFVREYALVIFGEETNNFCIRIFSGNFLCCVAVTGMSLLMRLWSEHVVINCIQYTFESEGEWLGCVNSRFGRQSLNLFFELRMVSCFCA